MIRAYVSNDIFVENPSPAMVRWCRQHLVLPNPDYYKKLTMGKWTGGTDENIFLYERDGEALRLPFGCLRALRNAFMGNIVFISKIRYVDGTINYQSEIKLYDYQEKAVEQALKAKNGVLVMPCGSGKTQSALEIISRIGGKCLWLTHTQDLLNQSLNRAKSTLGIDASSYGTITGGKVNIGSGITFATVQTMTKLDLKKYKDEWDIIIVDECHKAIGSPTRVMQFYKVLSNLSCRYKIGLTATPKRADGLEQSMFALLGGIIYEVSREAVADTTCPIRVETIETGYYPDHEAVLAGDGTINYAQLVNDLTHNEERFELVSNCINSLPDATLVLANRVEYIERLNKNYEGKSVCLSTLGNSKAAKAERKRALTALNDGDIDCLFASYKLAAEGLDCPNLKYIVLATPEKDPSLIQQATGRVGRKADDKEFGTVIDFVDEFGMYRGWWKKRKAVYKKLGYDII